MAKERKLTRRDLSGKKVYLIDTGYENILDRAGFRLGHNEGLYGWNWTAVLVAGRVVVYGYRNFPVGKSIDYNWMHDEVDRKLADIHDWQGRIDFMREKLIEYFKEAEK